LERKTIYHQGSHARNANGEDNLSESEILHSELLSEMGVEINVDEGSKINEALNVDNHVESSLNNEIDNNKIVITESSGAD
jgi:hypothetical protein